MRNTEYLTFAGSTYALNLNAFDKLLTFEPTPENNKITETETTQEFDYEMNLINSTVVTRQYQRSKEIDMPKYDIVKTVLDIILHYGEETDESLGMQRALDSFPIGFKIAFNTLINYGVLIEII